MSSILRTPGFAAGRSSAANAVARIKHTASVSPLGEHSLGFIAIPVFEVGHDWSLDQENPIEAPSARSSLAIHGHRCCIGGGEGSANIDPTRGCGKGRLTLY